MKGKVISVNIEKQKGLKKKPVEFIETVCNKGIKNDAHYGFGHRQISLLANESIDKMREKGLILKFGDFAENITTEGIIWNKVVIGDIFRIGEVLIRITQKGKSCHKECEIFRAVGDCIMPREGVFAEVLEEGTIHVNDKMEMVKKCGILIVSDSCFKREKKDTSGLAIAQIISKEGFYCSLYIVPDEKEMISSQLKKMAKQYELILTTGGTGLSLRDVTPEATMAVAWRIVPGIAEAIRNYSMQFTKRAALSRGVSVICNKSLIINLPGSEKAVKEGLTYILDSIPHALEVLRGINMPCG